MAWRGAAWRGVVMILGYPYDLIDDVEVPEGCGLVFVGLVGRDARTLVELMTTTGTGIGRRRWSKPPPPTPPTHVPRHRRPHRNAGGVVEERESSPLARGPDEEVNLWPREPRGAVGVVLWTDLPDVSARAPRARRVVVCGFEPDYTVNTGIEYLLGDGLLGDLVGSKGAG